MLLTKPRPISTPTSVRPEDGAPVVVVRLLAARLGDEPVVALADEAEVREDLLQGVLVGRVEVRSSRLPLLRTSPSEDLLDLLGNPAGHRLRRVREPLLLHVVPGQLVQVELVVVEGDPLADRQLEELLEQVGERTS